jgi:hypothetical protein
MPGLGGLIQHSFALRMPEDHRTLYGQDNHEQASEQFSLLRGGDGSGFPVRPVGNLVDSESAGSLAPHSPLVEHRLTNAKPWQMGFLEHAYDGGYLEEDLPRPFSWAGAERDEGAGEGSYDETRFVLCDPERREGVSSNDFMVDEAGARCESKLASRALLELLAHKRSLLFGLALADRFVNVMLPHAHLSPQGANRDCPGPDKDRPGSYILQPLVSLIRGSGGRGAFGRMYTLTFFLIPVQGSRYEARKMAEGEMAQMVNAGWSLASSPSLATMPRFDVHGPLPGYISRLSHYVGEKGKLSTLRQAIEAIAFGVALTMARDPADRKVRRRVGDDVVTSLGSARVSTVVVVDKDLTKKKVEKRMKDDPPGCLERLMKTLAGETRTPPHWSVAEQLKYRLDRHFVDENAYAFGVLPQNRCLIVASVGKAQAGRQESGLMQAGSAAYLTIGAATAIGTMRAINRDLEQAGNSEPGKIAKVDREIANNLHEIYDLDIIREAYRQLYRRLRDRLGIARDYETLRDKMQALYRATSTQHEVKAQRRLEWLTAAIVLLSILILLGTVILAVKPEA